MKLCLKSVYCFLLMLPLILISCGEEEQTREEKNTAASSRTDSLADYVPDDAFCLVRQDLAACAGKDFSRILHRNPKRISILTLLGPALLPGECRGESLLFILPGQAGESVRTGAVIRFDSPCVPAIFARLRDSFGKRGIPLAERHMEGQESLLLPGTGARLLLTAAAPDLLQMTAFSGAEPSALYHPRRTHALAAELEDTAYAFVYDLDAMPEAARSAFTGNETPETKLVRGFIRPSEKGAVFQIEARSADGADCGVRDSFLRRLAGGSGTFEGTGAVRTYAGVLASVKDRHQALCSRNLKQIHIALTEYAASHDGAFPPHKGAEGLDELRKETLPTARLYICAVGNAAPATVFEPLTEHNTSYAYFGGLRADGPGHLPVMIEYPSMHPDGEFGVLYADGRVSRLKPENGADLPGRLKAALGHEPASEAEKELLRQAQALSLLRRR